jgi:hypothetical protein
VTTETPNQPFAELAADLPDTHRAEFFQRLHEAGIGPNDIELARLLRALQLYKAYYESIPSAIKEAAERIDSVKREMEKLSSETHVILDASAKLAGQVIQESEKIRKDVTQINRHVEAAMSRSAENLASSMAAQLSQGIEQKVLMPLQNRLIELSGSNQSFDAAIIRNNRAASALEKSTTEARRFHIRAYVWMGCIILGLSICISYAGLHLWFSYKYAQQCTDMIKMVEKNRAVLLQLAKSRRTLELFDHPERPDRKLLIMKNATGWQSPDKRGVIEFEQ